MRLISFRSISNGGGVTKNIFHNYININVHRNFCEDNFILDDFFKTSSKDIYIKKESVRAPKKRKRERIIQTTRFLQYFSAGNIYKTYRKVVNLCCYDRTKESVLPETPAAYCVSISLFNFVQAEEYHRQSQAIPEINFLERELFHLLLSSFVNFSLEKRFRLKSVQVNLFY